MRAGPSKPGKSPKVLRASKQFAVQDHRFFSKRFIELQERETAAWKKPQGIQAPPLEPADEDGTPKRLQEGRRLEQGKIDNARPLTEKEQQEDCAN
ncbi:hypothetical protein FRC08_005081 [Ceratobasidium sp. 394]|nr:hypothetical protein FRC08_005081 [Ceratobasidium sp. 394]KAG9098668.1 hypothetical protein FS749_003292 [Ceratobasidium sp. UAMH 11750]